jgi:WD40 repeat protein/DNA-binding winged helix-turn-helix (wHTH) protein
MLYEFGAFCLDLKQRELKRNGEPVALPPRAFDLLALFLHHCNQVVTKDQMMKTVWSDRIVEEGNLSQNVFLLRSALGLDENGNAFIRTIPRFGYKFVAAVRVSSDSATSHTASGPSGESITAGYWSQHSPFRGLRAFESKDAWLFFGRAAETADLDNRVQHSSVVAVIGNSGSGKSSLVRAGLIPALRLLRFLPEDAPQTRWRVALFRPSNSPFDYLAEVLPGMLAPEIGPEELAEFTADLRVTLPLGGTALQTAIEELREAASEDARRCHYLLVVDQFEEIFTLTSDAGARARYIDALLAASRPNGSFPVHLLLVMRADFYGECLQHEELSRCLERNLYNLPRMTTEQLLEAIERRLALAAARTEPGLTESLLADVGAEAGNLALLEHALGQLWKKCGGYGGLLTNHAYEQIGRVRGALSQHADEVYESLGDDRLKHMAQTIFLELVHLGEGAQDTCRRVQKEDLLAVGDPLAVELLLSQLAASRLISIGGEGRQTFVEVSHEALIRNWPALRQWLARNREELALERRLLRAAEEWEGLNRDPGALLQGARLAQAEEWRSRHREAAAGLAQFLQASVQARAETELKQHEAQQRELAQQLELRRQAEARAAAEKQLREQQQAAALQMRQAAGRQRRFLWTLSALAALLLLAVTALWFAYRRSLTEQSRALAAQALELTTRDRSQARAVAIRGWRTFKTKEARFAVVTTFPEQVAVLKHEGRVVRAIFSKDGQRILTASYDHTARLWNAADGRQIALLAHNDKVEYAAFSADSQRVATASFDHTARLWSGVDGHPLATLQGHEDAVLSAVFSPDGRFALTASRDHTARLWNAADGSLLFTLRHNGVVTRAEFSPDGQQIITTCWDGVARLWSSVNGHMLATLQGHARELVYAGFSPDGRQVITAGYDHTARIWDSRDGRLLKTLQHQGTVETARFSPDGTRIVTASADNTARIWNAADGSLLATLDHEGAVHYAEFSSDGRYITTAAYDQMARLWNAADGRLLAAFQGHAGQVMHASIAPGNLHVVTAGNDRTARIWSLAGADLTAILKGHSDLVRHAAFSPDGRRIVTASSDSTAKIWDAESGRLLATLRGHASEISHVDYSPDGQHIVTAGSDNTARVWSSSDGRLLSTLYGHTGMVQFAKFSADSRRIVTASSDQTARIWNAADGHLLATLRGHTGIVWRARFSPDGRRVVTASADATARVWSSDNGNPISTLPSHDSSVADAHFSPEGQLLVTAGADAFARVWSSADGRLLATLAGHGGPVWCARFSPDGRRIVTASADATARIWDSTNGKLLAILEGHSAGLLDANFSPGGNLVATSSFDSTARLWNSADGSPLTTLRSHTDLVVQAAFSPNGQHLVTTSRDQTARVWKIVTLSDVEELLAK